MRKIVIIGALLLSAVGLIARGFESTPARAATWAAVDNKVYMILHVAHFGTRRETHVLWETAVYQHELDCLLALKEIELAHPKKVFVRQPLMLCANKSCEQGSFGQR